MFIITALFVLNGILTASIFRAEPKDSNLTIDTEEEIKRLEN